MNTLCKELKKKRSIDDEEDNRSNGRQKLVSSLQEAEKSSLFNEWRIKDVQKDVQTRDLIIHEKEKQIAFLTSLQQKNEQQADRIKDLEAKLFAQTRAYQQLELRIIKQAEEMGRVHQKRIEDARTAAMGTINEHVQQLQVLFQSQTDSKAKEDALCAFVVSTDAIRTAVGINLI